MCTLEELKRDKDIFLKAVSQDWVALQWASDELKGDEEVVLQAVSIDGDALQWASDEIKGDRDFVLKAVAIDEVRKRKRGWSCGGGGG